MKTNSKMEVQIIGTKKSNDTKKAMRFFSERRIKYHFRDVAEKGLSAGELTNIAAGVDHAELIDQQSAVYKKRGMQYLDFNSIEELGEYPLLLNMPVVRWRTRSTAGYKPVEWARWINEGG